VPLPELQATRAGSPTTVYAVESEGETVLRYLVRDSQGALVWVAAGEVSDIGGT
jgi:hypothetical protein